MITWQPPQLGLVSSRAKPGIHQRPVFNVDLKSIMDTEIR